MTRNMGTLDRLIRAVAGIALLAWALMSDHPMHWIGYFGLIPLTTALIGFCPVYRMLGINSCGKPPVGMH